MTEVRRTARVAVQRNVLTLEAHLLACVAARDWVGAGEAARDIRAMESQIETERLAVRARTKTADLHKEPTK